MQMLKVDKENALDAAEEAEILRKNSEEKAVKLEEEYQVGSFLRFQIQTWLELAKTTSCHSRRGKNGER